MLERASFPTTTPDETLAAVRGGEEKGSTTLRSPPLQVVEWLRSRAVAAVGVASFGPVELDPVRAPRLCSSWLTRAAACAPVRLHHHHAQGAGAEGGDCQVTTAPQPLWRNADVLGPLRALGVPLAFETDVNAPALSELAVRAEERLLRR